MPAKRLKAKLAEDKKDVKQTEADQKDAAQSEVQGNQGDIRTLSPDEVEVVDAKDDLDTWDAFRKLEEEADAQREAESAQPLVDPAVISNYHYFDLNEISRSFVVDTSDKIAGEDLLSSGHLRSLWDEMIYADYTNGARKPTYHVVLGDNTYEWAASLYFSKERIVGVDCDNRRCRYTYYQSRYESKVKLCPHEYAAYQLAMKRLKESDPADATDADTYFAMQKIASLIPDSTYNKKMAVRKVGFGNRKQDDLSKRLQLVPYVSIQSLDRVDDGSQSVSFKIGTGRLYKIKDLTEFVDKMDSEAEMPVGSKSILKLREDRLDEDGQKWLQFIRESKLQQRVFARHVKAQARSNSSSSWGYNYYDYTSRNSGISEELKDNIALFGAQLDRFMELAGSEIIEYTMEDDYDDRGRHQKYKLKLQDITYRPEFTLEPMKNSAGDFEGVTLRGRIEPAISGQTYKYQIAPPFVNRYTFNDQYEILQTLQQSAIYGDVKFRIGRQQMQAFYRDILPKLSEVADVKEKESALIQQYLYPSVSFATYLDVDEDMIFARVLAQYGSKKYTLMPAELDDASSAIYRDPLQESQMRSVVEQYLTGYDARLRCFAGDRKDETTFALLDTGLDELLSYGEVHMTDRFSRLKIKRPPKFSIGISVTQDSILNMSVDSEEMSWDEIAQILYHYNRKQKFIKLKNGDFLRIDEDSAFEQLIEMMQDMGFTPKQFVQGKMHIPMYRALYLDKMLENNETLYADRDRTFKKLIKEFKTVEDSEYEIPQGLKAHLRRYQKTGYRWLRTLDRYGFGGILADEMGLGKTLQAIAVLLGVKEEEGVSQDNVPDGLAEAGIARVGMTAQPGDEGDARAETLTQTGEEDETDGQEAVRGTSLIICPASLVYNWHEEIERFAPTLSCEMVVGTVSQRKEIIEESDADVLVTSYDLLKRDIDQYEGRKFRFAIIDEAQYIKNATTAQAKAVKLIQAKTRFALTGTPIENRLSELWSIFDYLMPGFLYRYEEFRSDFESPIVKNQDEAASTRLRRMIGPFVLRRKKAQVLKDLPEKLEEVRYAAMDGPQKKLYTAQALKVTKELKAQSNDDFKKNRMQVLSEITRLRQLCCDPSLVYSDYDGASGKREACLELLESVQESGHKALVFSQFVSMLELLEEGLKARGIPYYKIVGATPKEKRLELVKAFNADDTPVFLISLKAGGTGLNLTGADVVIHYDPWWNVSVENQATDRAHRIGQQKMVTVYKLIMKGTIEEKIIEMQESKKKLAEEVLGGETLASGTISREDLLAILE